MPPILPLGRGNEPYHHGVHKASGNKKKEAKQVVVIIASTLHIQEAAYGACVDGMGNARNDLDRDSPPTYVAESYCQEERAVPTDCPIPGAHARDDGTVLLFLKDVLHWLTKGASHACSSTVWNMPRLVRQHRRIGHGRQHYGWQENERSKIQASVEVHGSNAVAGQLMFLRGNKISHPSPARQNLVIPVLELEEHGLAIQIRGPCPSSLLSLCPCLGFLYRPVICSIVPQLF